MSGFENKSRRARSLESGSSLLGRVRLISEDGLAVMEEQLLTVERRSRLEMAAKTGDWRLKKGETEKVEEMERR